MQRAATRIKSAIQRLASGPPRGSSLPVEATGQAAGDILRSLIEAPTPCLIARLGRVEAGALLRCRRPEPVGSLPGDTELLSAMRTHAGFFPADDSHLRRFAARYHADLAGVDLLGAWLPDEDTLRPLFPHARFIPLADLEPYYHPNPWSQALAGCTVLVVHPFAASIRRQYANRAQLFADPRVLPEFELKTLPAVQTIAGGGERTRFANWFEALEWMETQMVAERFDVAIIGAGAYGLPLAAHAKRLGRKAVHLGGATQILFGIRGRRWDRHPLISKLYNPSWVRPLPEEIPPNYTDVEGGCYW